MLDLARKALSHPALYSGYQSLVGAPQCHDRFINEMVQPSANDRILDIGCGVGASIKYLPASVQYTGIDISPSYIESAQAEYGDRGQFICMDISSVQSEPLGTFDRAFAFGVLHHLSDEVVARVVNLVRQVVRPGGTFVTIDPCYVPGQHWLAKLLIDNDRGEHVRDVEGFRNLLSGLGDPRVEIHHDLLKVPFTQIVMQVRIP